jgi:hypothetical protein
MFLTKHPNRIWYLYYFDDDGRRRRISSKTRRKAAAVLFLQTFRQEAHLREVKRNRTSLTMFAQDYNRYSEGVHTPKTQRAQKTALAEFQRIIGDVALQTVTPRAIESFLATKLKEASIWSARKYFLAWPSRRLLKQQSVGG